MPFCSQCGSETVPEALFCSSCGSRIGGGELPGRSTPVRSSVPEPRTRHAEGNPFMRYFIGSLSNYAVFGGRASRRAYRFYYLFYLPLLLLAMLLDAVLDAEYLLFGMVFLATLLPTLALLVRRLHDVDRTGWFLLVPFYNATLLSAEGVPGDNRFGPDPLAG